MTSHQIAARLRVPPVRAFMQSVTRFIELLIAIAWKSVALRYKQAYFGVVWVALKPVIMVLIFMLLRSFVGIDSGDLPYPLLAYCALIPWIFFQEAASDGTGSVVAHSAIIRKIYVPREIFPLAAALTKTLDLGISLAILLVLMLWFGFGFQWSMLWVPLILIIALAAALTVSLAGSALNVYFRDSGQIVPLLLSLVMYASPVIYPLALVRAKLVDERAAGAWSDFLYLVYTLNPLTGVIESFQRVMLRGMGPDWVALEPGLALLAIALPASYWVFKRAERSFADFI